RLIRAYPVLTIKELLMLFPECNADMINAKVRRLKTNGLITKNKDSHVRKIAMKQRLWVRQIKPGEFNTDPDSWRKG
ncbi:MAG: hypothetical protein WAL98_22155, partial [Desulfatiglandaceae bacterium]